jgi:hypothetical protein
MPALNTERHALVTLRLTEPAATAGRTVTFLNRAFRVVPAVLIQSQVLQNNLGPSLLPPSVFTPEWAQLWNGIPVLAGPHPASGGQPVTGRNAALWDERGVGWLFNVQAEVVSPTLHRLVGEVWLDASRAEHVPELAAVFAALDAGQPVELSTGFPVHTATQSGAFGGALYELVLDPVGADHLVISTEFTGACSVSAGCGLGVQNFSQRATRMPEQQRTEPTPAAVPDTVAAKRGFFRGLAEFFTNADTASAQQEAEADSARRTDIERQVGKLAEALNAMPMSDDERRQTLRQALQRVHGSDERSVVVTDVFTAEQLVVFFIHTPLGAHPPGNEYFRAAYTETSGAFTFTEPVRVRRVTAYEPLVGSSGTTSAANTSPTTSRPGCGCSTHSLSEGDPMALDAAERTALVDEVKAGFATLLQPVTDSIAGIPAKVTEAVNAVKQEFETKLAEMTAKVDAMATVVNADRDAERQALVTQLAVNGRTPFTAAELEAKPLDELRKLAVMAKVDVTSYAGRGGPRPVANTQDEPQYAEPVAYHAKQANPNQPAGQE